MKLWGLLLLRFLMSLEVVNPDIVELGFREHDSEDVLSQRRLA